MNKQELDLNTQLSQLVQATCKCSPNSWERKQKLTKLMFLMQQSGKIWRGRNQINPEDYQEALQENWYFFSCNLCQQDPTAKKPYDAQKANVITWFNTYLEYKLKDIIERTAIEASRRAFPKINQETGEIISRLDMFPAQSEESVLMTEAFLKWLEENQRKFTKIHLRDRTEINAHLLISRRLVLEQTYQTIHKEFNVPITTLAKFYTNHCLPLIKQWGDSQGY